MPIVRLEFSLFLFPSSFGTHSCPGTLPEDALEALDVVVSTSFWKSANNKATIWTVIEATSLIRVLVIILAVELPAMSSFEQDRHYPALERNELSQNTGHLSPPAFPATKIPKLPKTRL